MNSIQALKIPFACLFLGISLAGCAIPSDNQRSGRTPALITQLDDATEAIRNDQPDKAARLYRSIAADYPNLAVAHLHLGNLAYQDDRPEAAQQHFKSALEREPGHVLATYNLAMVHLQTARELLAEHEQLAPVTAARPALVEIRQALEGLNRSHAHRNH